MRFRRLFSLVFLCSVFSAPLAWSMEDAILAIVNEEVITVKDLHAYLQGIFAQLKVEGRPQSEIEEILREYQAKGVEQLIDDRLILSAADTLGLQIRPEPVNERMEEIKKRYGSYEEFLTAIKREGLTVTEIRKKVENQLKGQVTVNNEVRSKVFVNPQEVTDYYNAHPEDFRLPGRVFLDTIFVKSDFGRDAARKKIEQARKKIKDGADFQAVLQEFSEAPAVGEMPEDQLRPEFKAQIDRMNINDVSDIIEMGNGFYIIKLLGRKSAEAASLKDVKDAIYQKLFEDKFRDRFKTWIEKLRKKAYVEIKS